ncbi:MAG: SEL1-like repeat protein, partial [archaeon]|nr:SEL1-like repeat protein [archaeon]
LRGIAKEFGARFRFEMGKETGDFFKSFLYKYLKAPKNKEGPVFVVCNKTRLHALLEEDYDTVIDIDTRNDAMTYLDSPHSLWANVLEVSMDGLMPVKSYITVFSPTRSKEFSQFGLKYRMPCSDCTLTVKGVDSGSKIREIASETKVTEAAYNVLGSKIAAGIEEDEVPGLLTVWDMAMNNPGRTNVLLGNMLKSDCAGNHLFAYEICRKEKNPVTEAFLGRMYRLGLTVEKDLAKAVDLLEGSLASGPKWVPKELYDALTETGTGPALERAEEILEKYPDADTEDTT